MEAPKLPSIFRNVRTKPRGFNYIPRYYDARKEELEQRIRQIEKDVALENRSAEIAKARLENGIRRKWDDRPNSLLDKGRSKRLLIVLGLLLALGRAVYQFMDL